MITYEDGTQAALESIETGFTDERTREDQTIFDLNPSPGAHRGVTPVFLMTLDRAARLEAQHRPDPHGTTKRKLLPRERQMHVASSDSPTALGCRGGHALGGTHWVGVSVERGQ